MEFVSFIFFSTISVFVEGCWMREREKFLQKIKCVSNIAICCISKPSFPTHFHNFDTLTLNHSMYSKDSCIWLRTSHLYHHHYYIWTSLLKSVRKISYIEHSILILYMCILLVYMYTKISSHILLSIRLHSELKVLFAYLL